MSYLTHCPTVAHPLGGIPKAGFDDGEGEKANAERSVHGNIFVVCVHLMVWRKSALKCVLLLLLNINNSSVTTLDGNERTVWGKSIPTKRSLHFRPKCYTVPSTRQRHRLAGQRRGKLRDNDRRRARRESPSIRIFLISIVLSG